MAVTPQPEKTLSCFCRDRLEVGLEGGVWRVRARTCRADAHEFSVHEQIVGRAVHVGQQSSVLVAGLFVTPLRWAGLNLIRFRRAIGLLAFFYVAMHLTAWVTLDMGLRWSEMAADLVKRWYIIIGMVGFAAMIPLAITSNNASVRRLGAATWNNLHRLTYVAALAGAIHYVVLVKAWPVEPMLYLGVILALLAARLWRSQQRRRAQAA